MGQTLTHGVYLPSEGERNCYSGLASNWRLLDGAIGTVAAHTTAIAGKASSSHTHGNISNDGKVGTDANKPLITGTGGAVQAGSFGTAANTFCEGNDSRLSDARTPVAHTHTKSDVTDLLNSNFIPSANNTYDLGSSSYQWNNLYAKNYYYNGVAWGLDKANTWSNFQRMTGNPAVWYLRNNTVTLGSTPPSNRYIGMFFEDVNGADLGYVSFQANKNSYNSIMFSLCNSDGTNAYTGALRYRASTTGAYSFFPETSACDLGTSTNKWKTINGINPGALSLPNVRAAEADPISTVGWNLSGSRNKYTPTEDGWFYIRVAGTGSCAINIHNGDTDNSYPTWFNTSTGGYATLVVPCEKGISLYIYISATSIEYCSFHPCLGNV